MLRFGYLMRLPVVTVSLVSAYIFLVVSSASATVGDQLDSFTPPHSGDGRGIAVKPASNTAYYTNQTALDSVYTVDLKSRTDLGTIAATNPSGKAYGSVAWDPTKNILWGAEYGALLGWLDQIDPTSGAVTRIKNTYDDTTANWGLDGLAVDSDGSLWFSPEGLNVATNTVNHYSAAGAMINSFAVMFGNSGVAVDGNDLWLADINNRVIHKYDKNTGTDTGVQFALQPGFEPEGLAVDNCTFAGKKALWVNAAGNTANTLSAYEIGTSDNAGCPNTSTTDPSKPKVTDPGAPSKITLKKRRGGFSAGKPISFKVPTDLDAALFTYYWVWDDYTGIDVAHFRIGKVKKRPAEKKSNEAKHTFKCGGYYRPKVKVLDAFGNEKYVELKNKKVTVNFPSGTYVKKGRTSVSPVIDLKGKKTIIYAHLDRGKKRSVKLITYKVDNKFVGRRRSVKGKVKKKLSAGPHVLTMTVKFRGGAKRKLKVCFQLTG